MREVGEAKNKQSLTSIADEIIRSKISDGLNNRRGSIRQSTLKMSSRKKKKCKATAVSLPRRNWVREFLSDSLDRHH